MGGSLFKVLSWNVYDENETLDDVFHFLSDTARKDELDVICLQEVPEELGARLISHFKSQYEFLSIDDHRNVKKHTCCKLLLFVRGKKDGSAIVQYRKTRRKRKQNLDVKEGDTFLYVDITFHSKKVRIFNVHFDAFARPWRRLSQLRSVCRSLDPKKINIVCGDFNIVDGWWYTGAFNLVRYPEYLSQWRRILMIWNERKMFMRRIRRSHLKSLFTGFTTFPGSTTFPSLWLQLDDILVSKQINPLLIETIEETYDSDHRPLVAHLEL